MKARAIAVAALGMLSAMLLPGDASARLSAQASENSLELRGSTSMLPVMQRIVEGYMTEHPEATISVSGGGSQRGLKALIVGVTEIAMANDEVPEDLAELAASRKVKLSACHPIYVDDLVAVVEAKNVVSDVSLVQLRDVFTRHTKNWSELGGADAPIEVWTHVHTSGTYDAFKRAVLGRNAVITPTAKVITSFEDLDRTIGEHAIGYIDLSRVGSLKPLTIGGVVASRETIANGTYPARRANCLFTLDPPPAIAAKLIDYALAPEKGGAVLASLGLLPATKGRP